MTCPLLTGHREDTLRVSGHRHDLLTPGLWAYLLSSIHSLAGGKVLQRPGDLPAKWRRQPYSTQCPGLCRGHWGHAQPSWDWVAILFPLRNEFKGKDPCCSHWPAKPGSPEQGVWDGSAGTVLDAHLCLLSSFPSAHN